MKECDKRKKHISSKLYMICISSNMLDTLLCRAKDSVHVRDHIKCPVIFSFFNGWLIVETPKLEDHPFSAVLYWVFDVIVCSYFPHLAAVFSIHNTSRHPVLWQGALYHVPFTLVPLSGGWLSWHSDYTSGSKRKVLRSDTRLEQEIFLHLLWDPHSLHFNG